MIILIILSLVVIFCGYSYMRYLECDDDIERENDRKFWTKYNKDREKYKYDYYKPPIDKF